MTQPTTADPTSAAAPQPADSAAHVTIGGQAYDLAQLSDADAEKLYAALDPKKYQPLVQEYAQIYGEVERALPITVPAGMSRSDAVNAYLWAHKNPDGTITEADLKAKPWLKAIQKAIHDKLGALLPNHNPLSGAASMADFAGKVGDDVQGAGNGVGDGFGMPGRTPELLKKLGGEAAGGVSGMLPGPSAEEARKFGIKLAALTQEQGQSHAGKKALDLLFSPHFGDVIAGGADSIVLNLHMEDLWATVWAALEAGVKWVMQFTDQAAPHRSFGDLFGEKKTEIKQKLAERSLAGKGWTDQVQARLTAEDLPDAADRLKGSSKDKHEKDAADAIGHGDPYVNRKDGATHQVTPTTGGHVQDDPVTRPDAKPQGWLTRDLDAVEEWVGPNMTQALKDVVHGKADTHDLITLGTGMAAAGAVGWTNADMAYGIVQGAARQIVGPKSVAVQRVKAVQGKIAEKQAKIERLRNPEKRLPWEKQAGREAQAVKLEKEVQGMESAPQYQRDLALAEQREAVGGQLMDKAVEERTGWARLGRVGNIIGRKIGDMAGAVQQHATHATANSVRWLGDNLTFWRGPGKADVSVSEIIKKVTTPKAANVAADKAAAAAADKVADEAAVKVATKSGKGEAAGVVAAVYAIWEVGKNSIRYLNDPEARKQNYFKFVGNNLVDDGKQLVKGAFATDEIGKAFTDKGHRASHAATAGATLVENFAMLPTKTLLDETRAEKCAAKQDVSVVTQLTQLIPAAPRKDTGVLGQTGDFMNHIGADSPLLQMLAPLNPFHKQDPQSTGNIYLDRVMALKEMQQRGVKEVVIATSGARIGISIDQNDGAIVQEGGSITAQTKAAAIHLLAGNIDAMSAVKNNNTTSVDAAIDRNVRLYLANGGSLDAAKKAVAGVQAVKAVGKVKGSLTAAAVFDSSSSKAPSSTQFVRNDDDQQVSYA